MVHKGATSAWPGRGFVGGPMGDDAGRPFGRNQARHTFKREQIDAWLRKRGVLRAGGGLDQSPMTYRRLPEVLAQHAGTIRILHTLRPFAVAMAGDGGFDPPRD